jgi:hypothetical protein
LESDPAAHDVLVSEIITDDPDVSDVWTFNGPRCIASTTTSATRS